VATTSGVTPYLNQNRLGGWSGWYALPALTQLPIGFTHGNVWMAVAGKQSGAFQSQNMLVSPNLVLGATPPWPTFTWTSAGSPPANRSFKGNPAIVTPGALGTDRVDYFAYVSDASDNFGLIYTRWKFNGAWQDTGWTALPSIPGVNIKSSPSVGLQGSTYYVAVRGSDNNIWITTLPNVSNSGTYGGPWTDWFALWGQYLGPPALTAWDRGVDVYGIGQDNNLYHLPMDADGSWSDPIQLNATFMNTTALTASNYLPSTHEIAVVGISGSPISPQITRYAW
jgi:hypothetical protein